MEYKLKKFKNEICVTRIANIHYFEFAHGFHTYQEKHSFRELVYVDSGIINVRSEEYEGVLLSNQMIIHKADAAHSLYCVQDDAPSVIVIGFECMAEVLDLFASAPITLNTEQKKLLAQVIKEGRNVFLPPYDMPNLKDMKKRKNCPFGADQLIKLNLEKLFIDLVRCAENPLDDAAENPSNLHMADIARYLDENYKEKITLNELCFLFNSNKTTICSQFKADYGDTVIGYINRRRIKAAKKMLREGNMNITQIAAQVGFDSIHYFSKTFKKYENKSPSEYMNTIKSYLEI